jgi:hypothetical protein
MEGEFGLSIRRFPPIMQSDEEHKKRLAALEKIKQFYSDGRTVKLLEEPDFMGNILEGEL